MGLVKKTIELLCVNSTTAEDTDRPVATSPSPRVNSPTCWHVKASPVITAPTLCRKSLAVGSGMTAASQKVSYHRVVATVFWWNANTQVLCTKSRSSKQQAIPFLFTAHRKASFSHVAQERMLLDGILFNSFIRSHTVNPTVLLNKCRLFHITTHLVTSKAIFFPTAQASWQHQVLPTRIMSLYECFQW